jgi:hypothetical protein
MSKLSRGGIAGIVVGCVLVLLAIILCFYELHLRKKKKARRAAPTVRLCISDASGTSYEGRSYGFGIAPAIRSSSRPSPHFQDDSTFAPKVREVRPDPVGGEVWMPRLFDKIRVRLKTIQDDVELV